MSQLGDPSDKLADGMFSATPHRAGYGSAETRLNRIHDHALAGHTLAAGEGKLLVEYYEAELASAARALALVAEARAAWQRRFNAIRGHDTFIEKRGDRWPYLWTEPATEYRAMDVCVGAFYGNSPEEAADALADFWEQYERDSAATPVDAAPRDGGSDEPTPF